MRREKASVFNPGTQYQRFAGRARTSRAGGAAFVSPTDWAREPALQVGEGDDDLPRFERAVAASHAHLPDNPGVEQPAAAKRATHRLIPSYAARDVAGPR